MCVPQKAVTTRYADVRPEICDGDVLLFRWTDLISVNTLGPCDHAGMAKWAGEALMCAESKQWTGARMVPLSSRVKTCPRRIDVFRPKCSGRLRSAASDLMALQCGHRYGWPAIAAVTLRHLPLVWSGCCLWQEIFHGTVYRPDREPRFEDPKFCSEQVIWSYRDSARRLGEKFEACRWLPSQFVEPNHLYHDPTFELVFQGLTL